MRDVGVQLLFGQCQNERGIISLNLVCISIIFSCLPVNGEPLFSLGQFEDFLLFSIRAIYLSETPTSLKITFHSLICISFQLLPPLMSLVAPSARPSQEIFFLKLFVNN